METTLPLEKRSVVSCFIFKLPIDYCYRHKNGDNDARSSSNVNSDAKPKVALFLRSAHPNIRTYKNHIAPISGSIMSNSHKKESFSTAEQSSPSSDHGKFKPNLELEQPSSPQSQYQSESPLSCAYRELHEETGLTPSDLVLFRRGKPYSFLDESPSVMRQWTIYPFAFRLRLYPEGESMEKRIRIDWEHQSWNWYNPGEILDMLTGGSASGGAASGDVHRAEESFVKRFGYPPVPRLNESLGRVWVEDALGRGPYHHPKRLKETERRRHDASLAGLTLAKGLHQLQTDHHSGARELAGMALGIFKNVLLELDSSLDSDNADGGNDSDGDNEEGSKAWWDDVRMIVWHLWKNGRESMGSSILNALLEALQEIEQVLPLKRSQRWLQCQDILMSRLQDRKLKVTRISDSFLSYAKLQCIGSNPKELRILTLSSSSTLRTALINLVTTTPDLRIDLKILESRPLFEGVGLASAITREVKSATKGSDRSTVRIVVYTDASSAIASRDIDFLLLGADRISADGSVSNKTGSLPAVLSARYASPRCKVVVLSELEKVAITEEHGLEENDSQEVLDAWKNGNSAQGARWIEEALLQQDENGGASPVLIQVKNTYFEWVSPHLIDAYICEDGETNVRQIKDRSEWIGGMAKKYFEDL